jgi:tRNA-2-methylthio-N6-dimethylallyladenosine synthase
MLPDCAITTDIIVGFSGETIENHQDTLSIMHEVGYEYAYMFKYSERGGTLASKQYPDDIPDEEKTRRLEEVIALQGELSMASNLRDVGKTFRVLVEGASKRSDDQLFGRNSQNKVIVFDKGDAAPGSYRRVRVKDCTQATLLGELTQ